MGADVRRRRTIRWIVAAVLSSVVLGSAGFSAEATPHKPAPNSPTPTAEQVRAARQHARQVADEALRARARVHAAQRQLAALNADLEILVERWNGARADVADASNQLMITQAAESTALAQAQFAQNDVDRLAVQTYQLGPDLAGGMGPWVAVMDSVVRSGGISTLTDQIGRAHV